MVPGKNSELRLIKSCLAMEAAGGAHSWRDQLSQGHAEVSHERNNVKIKATRTGKSLAYVACQGAALEAGQCLCYTSFGLPN